MRKTQKTQKLKGIVKQGRAGPGRPKGVPPRLTREAREAFRDFVEGNTHRIQELFDRVAHKQPAKALDLYCSISEFCLPKLQRTELNLTPITAGATIVVTDAVAAAAAYERIISGEITADAVRFTALPSSVSSAEAPDYAIPASTLRGEPPTGANGSVNRAESAE